MYVSCWIIKILIINFYNLFFFKCSWVSLFFLSLSLSPCGALAVFCVCVCVCVCVVCQWWHFRTGSEVVERVLLMIARFVSEGSVCGWLWGRRHCPYNLLLSFLFGYIGIYLVFVCWCLLMFVCWLLICWCYFVGRFQGNAGDLRANHKHFPQKQVSQSWGAHAQQPQILYGNVIIGKQHTHTHTHTHKKPPMPRKERERETEEKKRE
jgi:hypothetical protein